MARSLDLCWLADWEQAKDKLVVWLINPDGNGALIGDGPSVPFLDLICVFYVRVFSEAPAAGYVHVKHGLASIWGQTPEQLFQQATANIDAEGIKVAPLADVINSIAPEEYQIVPDKDTGPAPIFMLNNGNEHGYGAAVIVSEQARKELCKRFGEDMYILPSSVHELLLVPADGRAPLPELQKLVERVNRESVDTSDRLSDSVYLLRASDAGVTIAAGR